VAGAIAAAPVGALAAPVTGTASGSGTVAVTGTATSSGIGVKGTSDGSAGVYGTSTSSTGVVGQGASGVVGISSSADPANVGVSGSCALCTGVLAFSSNFIGLDAESSSGTAITAQSFTGHAINASSESTDAIIGTAGTNSGATGVWGVAHGAGTYGLFSSGDLYVRGWAGTPGDAFKPGGGSWKATSDARVKKDVKDFQLSLSALESVRPVRFKYNGLGGTTDNGREYVGVIAQELEKVMPFMVSSHKRKLHESDHQATDVKEVDPSAFTYVLINSVQELSKQNKANEAREAEMSRRLDALARKNDELASQVRDLTQVARLACRDRPTESICMTKLAPAPATTLKLASTATTR
jgi:hypothetical protein